MNGLPYGGGMFWDSFRPYGSDLELAPEYFKTQIPLYIEQGMAYEADTIEELAGKIGCDADDAHGHGRAATTACARRARTPTTTRSPYSSRP